MDYSSGLDHLDVMKPDITISVIIPVYNAADTLQFCLEAICATSVSGYEIIVVDDGSNDDSRTIARNFQCRIHQLHEQGGAAAARNAGARIARGRILLFVDADVIVPGNLIERIVDNFNRDDVVAVQTLYTCPGRYSDTPSRYQNDYYHYFCTRIPGDNTSVFATWCAAVSREVFLSIGGFDQRIPGAAVEDEEFGYELVDRGYRIFLDRSLTVEHLARYSMGSFMKRRFFMARSQIKSAIRKAPLRFRRYADLGQNPTHHSRRVLLCIPLSFLIVLCGILFFISPSLESALCIFLSWLFLSGLVFDFLRFVGKTHGTLSVIPSLIMFWLDMMIVGCGLGYGAFEYTCGRRY